MDFAKKQLEKYGWQEGKGLGKNENGITNAIKPKLKFDTVGIGHDSSEQFTNNWWEKLYNNASSNLNVTTASNGNVQVNVSDPDGVEITTKSYSVKNFKKNNSNNLEYGSFRKTSKLTEKGVVDLCDCFDVPAFPNTNINLCPLTDAELFAACEGRTAHKGARHGLTLNGKLSRLEKQEKLLLKRLRKVSLSDETETKDCKENLEKKLRKISDHKDKHGYDSMEEGITDSPVGNPISVGFTTSPHKNGKNRKKERKRVSFSETVTEYQTQEVESNSTDNPVQDVDLGALSDCNSRPPTPIITVRKVEIKDESPESVPIEQDEGIESDTSSYLHAKIKEDNYKMKRKLRKLRKKYAAAESSKKHAEHDCNENKSSNNSDNYMKCIKRKIIVEEDSIDRNSKRHRDNYLDNVIDPNYRHFELKTKKERKRQKKKQKRLEKRINRVADSLNELCKISDIESE